MKKKRITISTRGRFPKTALLLLVLCLFLPIYTKDSYIIHLAISFAITGALATNYNLSAGYAGQVSFAHAAFYGIGAYTAAILITRYAVNFWICLPIAFIGATFVGFLMGLPTLRLRGTYRVICTIGFQAIVDTVLLRWVSLTNGPIGITGIPSPVIFGIKLDTPQTFFFLAYIWLLINIVLIWRIESSRLGFELLAIKGEESAAVACGVISSNRKLWAFSVSAGLAAVTGCLFAAYVQSVAPSAFNLFYSPVILCMALLGGNGTVFGGLIGAVILGLIPEIARPIQNYRMIIYGLTMILLVLFMPNGILGVITKIANSIKQKNGGKAADVNS